MPLICLGQWWLFISKIASKLFNFCYVKIMELDKKLFGQIVKFRLENMVYKQHLEINHFARQIFCHLLVLSSPVTFWNMGFGIALCGLRLGLISCWFLIGQQPSAEYIYLVKIKSISFLISPLKLLGWIGFHHPVGVLFFANKFH